MLQAYDHPIASNASITFVDFVKLEASFRRSTVRVVLYSFTFRHFAVPPFDVCTDEIEDSFERRNHHSSDVVIGVEAESPNACLCVRVADDSIKKNGLTNQRGIRQEIQLDRLVLFRVLLDT